MVIVGDALLGEIQLADFKLVVREARPIVSKPLLQWIFRITASQIDLSLVPFPAALIRHCSRLNENQLWII